MHSFEMRCLKSEVQILFFVARVRSLVKYNKFFSGTNPAKCTLFKKNAVRDPLLYSHVPNRLQLIFLHYSHINLSVLNGANRLKHR